MGDTGGLCQTCSGPVCNVHWSEAGWNEATAHCWDLTLRTWLVNKGEGAWYFHQEWNWTVSSPDGKKLLSGKTTSRATARSAAARAAKMIMTEELAKGRGGQHI